ncbi:MAG: alpha/beta hydrolase [Spirochaetales bacterium]|nr:alpha/beta hydrolase [Spirochaetales bacterium]
MRILYPTTLLCITFTLISCGSATYTPGEISRNSILDPPKQKTENEGFWQVDDSTTLYHFSQGDPDGTPVLLLHGGPAAPFSKPWPGLSEIDGYKFHYYHQRGSGESTIPFERFETNNFPQNVKALDDRLGMARLIEDVEKIRRILDTEKIILIGHSFGGFIATLYAIEFPERVQKMILIEPADMLSFPPSHGGMEQIKEWLTDEQKAEYEAYMKEYFNYRNFFKKSESELAELNSGYGKYYFQALENHFPGASSHPEEIESRTKNGGFAGHAPFFSLGRKYDHRELLHSVRAPVLVLHGKMDLFGPETGLEYVEYLPNGVYNEMENSSHFPFYEEPEEFSRLIELFLNKPKQEQ